MKRLGTRLVIVFIFYLLLFFYYFLRRQIITNSIFQHPNLSYPQGLSLPFEVKCTDYYPVLQTNSSKNSNQLAFIIDRTELILTTSPSALQFLLLSNNFRSFQSEQKPAQSQQNNVHEEIP